jgi:hypothetical protein
LLDGPAAAHSRLPEKKRYFRLAAACSSATCRFENSVGCPRIAVGGSPIAHHSLPYSNGYSLKENSGFPGGWMATDDDGKNVRELYNPSKMPQKQGLQNSICFHILPIWKI